MLGTGTANDPYIIENSTDLQNMDVDLTAYYELGGHIDCSGIANFEPVGGWNAQNPFTGSFDGKGYKIHNLTVDRAADDNIGLFGEINSATIHDVTLETFTLTGDDYIGGLFGESNGAVQIHNITVNGITIVGDDYLGGLCGYAYDHSFSNVTITGLSINGDDNVGGLAGLAYGSSGKTITNCTTAGTISAGQYVGGLFGNYYLYDASGCSSSVNVTGHSTRVGGVVGQWWSGTFEKSSATGTVEGYSYVGGFAGYMRSVVGTETADKCFATGEVTGTDDFVGGFVGYQNEGDINDCYARGIANGSDYVGGFAGLSDSLNRCYSTGSITHGVGQTNVGGFTGNNNGSMVRCFWDKTTSGEATGAGGGSPQTGVTGHLTADMKLLATFSEAGWTIPRTWNVLSSCNSGYPCLVQVNSCCSNATVTKQGAITPDHVSLELIRTGEMQFGGRVYVDKSGKFNTESRYKRGA